MRLNIYEHRTELYMPVVGVVDPGFTLEIGPVEVVPSDDAIQLARALRRVVSRGNPRVPRPPVRGGKQPVVVKAAQVRSWSAFASEARTWSVLLDYGRARITSYRRLGGGSFEPRDPIDVTVESPPDFGKLANWLTEYIRNS